MHLSQHSKQILSMRCLGWERLPESSAFCVVCRDSLQTEINAAQAAAEEREAATRREAELHSSERARLQQELSSLRARHEQALQHSKQAAGEHEQALERSRQNGEQRLSELHETHAEEQARLQRELSSLQVCV